jgi:antitoxin VapB
MRELIMIYARVFQSGNSQAIRLPKEFRFDVEQVEIFRRGDEIILRPRSSNAMSIFNAITDFPADFMAEGREDFEAQERESF